MMDFEGLTKAFRDNPLPALVAIQMLAIVTLFVMLVRSLTRNADQSARYLAATEKFRELAQEMNETLLDAAGLRSYRARRKAGEKTGEHRVPAKPEAKET